MKFVLKGIKRGSERLHRRLTEKKKHERIKKKKAKALYELSCNLCHRFFAGVSPLFRFCRDCKETSELFRFHDTHLA